MKHGLRISFFLAVILLTVISCRKKEATTVSESNKKEVVLSRFAGNYPDFNPKVLRDVLESGTQNDSILNPFYAATKYTPLWVHDTLDTKNLNEFIQILSKADEHGLSPELFSMTKIQSMTDSINTGVYTYNLDTLYAKISLLEQISTRAAIKYISGMKFGFLNPKTLYGEDYDITLSVPDSTFFVELYAGIKQNPITSILNAHPTDSIYLKLQDEYKLLESRKETGFKKITAGDVTYKLGDKSKHISDIAERLKLTGEYAPDSIGDDSLHRKLDEALLTAVNTFRKRNSYPEEKEVGKLTIDALNRPFEYYQDKVRANMERYRWKRTKKKHDKHIEVNVAAAMLVASQTDSSSLTMRVCVGSIRNKTPLLQSNISYLNLNPIWNVPKSIAQKEVAVLQKRDTSYIRKHRMRLYKGGKEVDVTSIDWKTVNPGSFNYLIKQDPGAGNSLGLVKFMFNNAFSVYLHDTPSKAAFNRKNRAVSHGCVRVQKPFDLAFFCTSPTTDIYKDQLLFSINKPPLTKEGKQLLKEEKLKKLPDIINLKPENKISLFIDYYTAFMYPDDDILYYADDTYEYDNTILEALKPEQITQQKKEDI